MLLLRTPRRAVDCSSGRLPKPDCFQRPSRSSLEGKGTTAGRPVHQTNTKPEANPSADPSHPVHHPPLHHLHQALDCSLAFLSAACCSSRPPSPSTTLNSTTVSLDFLFQRPPDTQTLLLRASRSRPAFLVATCKRLINHLTPLRPLSPRVARTPAINLSPGSAATRFSSNPV